MRRAFIDSYSHQDTRLHRAAPSLKLFSVITGLFLLVLLPLIVQKPTALFMFSALLLLLGSLFFYARIPVSFVFHRSLLLLPFFFFIVLINLVNGQAELLSFILLLLRVISSIFLILLLITTTKFIDIIRCFERWRLPRPFVIIFTFMYRYFFIIMDEADKMRCSVLMRQGKSRTLTHFSLYGHLIGLLFIRSYERAEKVYYAMALRGFDGKRENL